MIEQHSFAALAASLSVGLLLAAAPNDSAAAPLAFDPGAMVPATPLTLLPAAEKKSTTATQQRSTVTKKAAPTKKATTSTTKQKQPSSNTGSAKTGSTGSGTKSTGTGSFGGGTKTTGGTKSTGGTKTKTPDIKSGDLATKERGTGSTTEKSLDDLLSGKTPAKEAKTQPSEESAPVLNAPAEGEGTTYTSQQVTQEQLDQYAEEHPDELSDSDGDGVYESIQELGEDAQVVVEDGKVYLDANGDGEFEAVVPAEYYDAESNTFKIPVSAENYSISDGDDGPMGYVDGEQAAIYADLDGDGVDEIYAGWDWDGDGVAEVVDPRPVPLGGDNLTKEELAAKIESGEIKQIEYPDFGQGYAEENGNGTKQRPRFNVGLSVAPAPSAANGGAAAGGGLDANAMVANLQQLKMLREQGVLSAVEHDNAQLRALADVNAQQTGIEDGLGLLRRLWENDLITQAPYARKRQELLDAL